MISFWSVRFLIKYPSFKVIFTQRNNMSWKSKAGNHSSMEFRPVYNCLLVLFQVQSYFYIVWHNSVQINFRYFYDVGDERSWCSQVKGSLSDYNRQFSVGEFQKNVLAFNFPFFFRNWLDIFDFDFNFWSRAQKSINLFKDQFIVKLIHLWGVRG